MNRTSVPALLLLTIIAGLLAVLVYQNASRQHSDAAVTPTSELPQSGPEPSSQATAAAALPSSPASRLAASAPVASPAVPENAFTAPPAASDGLVPLVLKLPTPGFPGTPKDLVLSSYVEPLSDKPRPPLMVPPGLTNIARQARVTSGDPRQTPEALARIVDGDKEATDESIVFLRKGLQWVQLDLGDEFELFAIVVWHAHDRPKVYHDVVVLAGTDPDLVANVHTLYNNDQDNTSGLGAGTDKEYFETHEGRLINPRGEKARFLRFYSRGSTESALNEYTELEVYARKPE